MPIGALEILMILLITAGPLRALPYFHAVTAAAEPGLRASVGLRAAVTCGIALLAFLLIGQPLLGVFHVSLPALMIAGGVILLTYSLGAISDSGDPPEPATSQPSPSVAIHPIGLPMMASPQAMTAVVVIASTARGALDLLLIAICIVVVAGLNWAALNWAEKILATVPAGVVQVLNRIVALLLAGMAMQLVVLGLVGLGLVDQARAR